MIFAQGARFGGHALFVKDRRLHYVYNFIGIPPEQHLESGEPLEPGRHVLGVEFVKESLGDRHETPRHGEALRRRPGRRRGAARTQPRPLRALRRGPLDRPRLRATPSASEYTRRLPVHRRDRSREVEVNIGDDVYLDVEREFAAALARD